MKRIHVLLIIAFLVGSCLCFRSVCNGSEVDWSGRADVGFMGKEGSSDEVSGNARVVVEREAEDSRLQLKGEWIYSEDDGDKSGEEVRLDEGFEVDLGSDIYWLMDSRFEYNWVQDLDRRVFALSGFGVYVMDGLSVDVVGGYEVEKYADQALEDDGIVRIRQRFNKKFDNGIEVVESVEVFPEVDDLDNLDDMYYRLVGEVELRVPIVSGLALSNRVRDEYRSKGEDKNDLMVITGVSYSF